MMLSLPQIVHWPWRRSNRRVSPGLYAPAVLATAWLCGPLLVMVLHIPWIRVPELLFEPDNRHALLLSIGSAVVTTGLAVVLGCPLAVVLARATGAVALALRVLIMLPMALPPVVAGLALLHTFGRQGVIGGPLFAVTGIAVTYTPYAVVIAQLFVAMPFLVLTVAAALERVDPDLADAAATMGATPWQVVRYVSFPLVAPSIAAGALLCFARALGEFGATITVAGNMPGLTQTMPTAVFLALNRDADTALALGALLLAVAAIIVTIAAIVMARTGHGAGPH